MFLFSSGLQKPLRQNMAAEQKQSATTTTTALPPTVTDLKARNFIARMDINPFECTRRYISREIKAFGVTELMKSYENSSVWNTATVLVSELEEKDRFVKNEVVVKYTVIEGNHRISALKKLSKKHPDVATWKSLTVEVYRTFTPLEHIMISQGILFLWISLLMSNLQRQMK